ncbi:22473_t:CDS:2 [Gigaspora margarita]|uniref:22473_t:CDS:1 n=1 Tax=Gigaspora margarita TaxID=4874 RepID=A0ABN7V4E0_GIGMA|nr:22473_t:CDS:2 [Gigaspora margarita]
MAKNVLEIRTANRCNIHNRACLNKSDSKENHVEIIFMMLLIWASEINKGLATPVQPPTHPLFAYQHLSKMKTSNLQYDSNLISSPNPYLPFPFYNLLQAFSAFFQLYSTSNISEQTSQATKLTILTIGDFLKQVDENEGTNNYYQMFLVKLEQQRISVRILSKLSDEEFEKCGIDTISAQKTLRDYASKYSNFNC